MDNSNSIIPFNDSEVLIRIEECSNGDDELIVVNSEGIQYYFDNTDNLFKVIYDINDIFSNSCVCFYNSNINYVNNFIIINLTDSDHKSDLINNNTIPINKNRTVNELDTKIRQIAEKHKIIDRLMMIKDNLQDDGRNVKDRILEKFRQLQFDIDRGYSHNKLLCHRCKKLFTSRYGLSKHNLRCSDVMNSTKMYKCKCNRNFKKFQKLTSHIKKFKKTNVHGYLQEDMEKPIPLE